jgi:hypothetical protein
MFDLSPHAITLTTWIASSLLLTAAIQLPAHLAFVQVLVNQGKKQGLLQLPREETRQH